MGIVVDTSIFVAAERGRFDSKRYFADQEDDLFIASMSIAELLNGWELAPAGRKKNERKQHVEDITAKFSLIDFDLKAARFHAHVWAALRKSGQMINANDIVIAACALAGGHDIATLNAKDFERVLTLALRDVSVYQIPGN